MLPLMQQLNQQNSLSFPRKTGQGTYPSRYGIVTHSDLRSSLAQLRWSYTDHFEPDLAFLEEMSDCVDDWIILMPQLKRGSRCILPDLGARSVFYRKRSRDPLFQAVSDPKHRHAARRIACLPKLSGIRMKSPMTFARQGAGC